MVTPDGTRLAFISHKSLTGYDNAASNGTSCGSTHYGGPQPLLCREVFEYNAVTDQLACASCNPSGARPAGPSSLPEEQAGGEFDSALAAVYRSRAFSEGGALFFQSFDALVPHARDGRQNVYEYEDGRVYPISDVVGSYESYFLDASASGNDVFFATADQLVSQDRDNRIDVYDARVDGGFPASVPLQVCDNGDSCKPPATPQPGVFGAPASATFSGAGNPAPATAAGPVLKPKAKPVKCRRGFMKKKTRCVKKPKLKRRAIRSTDRKGSK